MCPAIVAVPTSPGTALPRYQKVSDQSGLFAPPSGAAITAPEVMPTASSGLFTPMLGITTARGTPIAGASRLRRRDVETAESRLWRWTWILEEGIATYCVDGPEFDVRVMANTTAATAATPPMAIRYLRRRASVIG